MFKKVLIARKRRQRKERERKEREVDASGLGIDLGEFRTECSNKIGTVLSTWLEEKPGKRTVDGLFNLIVDSVAEHRRLTSTDNTLDEIKASQGEREILMEYEKWRDERHRQFRQWNPAGYDPQKSGLEDTHDKMIEKLGNCIRRDAPSKNKNLERVSRLKEENRVGTTSDTSLGRQRHKDWLKARNKRRGVLSTEIRDLVDQKTREHLKPNDLKRLKRRIMEDLW